MRIGNKSKRRYVLHSLLRDWYGAERARAEISAYYPDAVNAGDAAEKVMEQAFTPEMLAAIRLRSAWPELVGRQLAAVSAPVNIRRGVLYVQVSHSAWLRELQGPIKKHLTEKINATLGDVACSGIKFVPGGR